jgi:hypothetical protein
MKDRRSEDLIGDIEIERTESRAIERDRVSLTVQTGREDDLRRDDQVRHRDDPLGLSDRFEVLNPERIDAHTSS